MRAFARLQLYGSDAAQRQLQAEAEHQQHGNLHERNELTRRLRHGGHFSHLTESKYDTVRLVARLQVASSRHLEYFCTEQEVGKADIGSCWLGKP